MPNSRRIGRPVSRRRRRSRARPRRESPEGTVLKFILITGCLLPALVAVGGGIAAQAGMDVLSGASGFVMATLILVAYLAAGPFGCAWLAGKKGRDGALWFLVGLVLWYVALFILLFAKDMTPRRSSRRTRLH